MKILVSQKGKNPSHSSPDKGRSGGVLIEIKFKDKKLEEKFIIAKSEEFLNVIDKLIRKRKIGLRGLMGQIGSIEFYDVGLLTERTIRVIMQGLSFS